MARRNGNGGPPATPWMIGSVIGGVIGVVAITVVALWTIVTYEAANNKNIIDKIEAVNKSITDDLKSNYVINSRHNDLEGRLVRETNRITEEHKQFIDDLRREHDSALSRTEFHAWRDERTKAIDELREKVGNKLVDQKEFVQYSANMLEALKVLQARLASLEQTRPTTGELQATANALRDRIEKLYQMIQSQEDYLRSSRQMPLAQPKLP